MEGCSPFGSGQSQMISVSHPRLHLKGIAMRLATLATPAGPRPVLRSGDDYVDLLAADPTLPASVRGILTAGSDALGAAKRAAEKGKKRTPVAEVKFLAPIPDPAKIICLGLNYRDHALESGAAIPNEPVL